MAYQRKTPEQKAMLLAITAAAKAAREVEKHGRIVAPWKYMQRSYQDEYRRIAIGAIVAYLARFPDAVPPVPSIEGLPPSFDDLLGPASQLPRPRNLVGAKA